MSSAPQPDDYRALAPWYDLVYAKDGPDDIPFYLDHAARQAGPGGSARILELGCGTGRVTLPLACAGHHMTALDISPAMLGLLRDKLEREAPEPRARVEVVQGDMAAFDLSGGDDPPQHPQQRFDLIIAPFRAFQHLMEPARQRAMLTCVRAHLAPGGVYIHNQFEPNYRFVVENMQRGASARLDAEVELPDGGLLQRWTTLNYDLGRQRLDAQFRLDEYAADGRLCGSTLERVAMRLTHRWELLHLLELCGLHVRAALDGYHGVLLGPELARELVLVCGREPVDA